MKLSIAAIALLFGANSLVAAITVKGRGLKGQSKVKKSKNPCPKRTAYNAPAGCIDSCYSDMTKLSNDINAALAVPGPIGPTFTGTICSGTWVWPATASVSGALANAKLDLSCCGSENSCVITGETPSVTRSTRLMEFSNPSHLILQGLSFANITSEVEGTLVFAYFSTVVEVNNVMVDSVTTIYPGGVFFFSQAIATINNSKFTNNTGGWSGGAIYASYSIIEMNSNTLVENVAENGGALGLIDTTLFATCNSFVNNTATFEGGAISDGSSHLQLTNNQFLGNQAKQGGAVSIQYQSIVSHGNTYSKNVASENGGAVSFKINGAGELVDDTFTENSAPSNHGSDVFADTSALKYCNCPTLTPLTLNVVNSIALDQCV